MGTDGLVVLIVLPMRDVMLGLIRLFVTVFHELLFDGLFKFLNKLEVLPDALSLFRFELLRRKVSCGGLMVLPMRDVMLGLIMLFVLLSVEVEELPTERLTVLLLLMLFRLD